MCRRACALPASLLLASFAPSKLSSLCSLPRCAGTSRCSTFPTRCPSWTSWRCPTLHSRRVAHSLIRMHACVVAQMTLEQSYAARVSRLPTAYGVGGMQVQAMENWGLLVFEQTRIEIAPGTAPFSERFFSHPIEEWCMACLVVQASCAGVRAVPVCALSRYFLVADTVAHELSHQVRARGRALDLLWITDCMLRRAACIQWCGNLVTMAWWNDLWLNEASATNWEYFGVRPPACMTHCLNAFRTVRCLHARTPAQSPHIMQAAVFGNSAVSKGCRGGMHGCRSVSTILDCVRSGGLCGACAGRRCLLVLCHSRAGCAVC